MTGRALDSRRPDMKKLSTSKTFVSLAALLASSYAMAAREPDSLNISKLGTYSVGIFSDVVSGAEISAHDPKSQRLFVVNGAQNHIEVLNIKNPSAPVKLFSIDCSPYGSQPNSVACNDGVVAVAMQAAVKTDAGKAVFFDIDGNLAGQVTVGALPDMITFSPNGRYVLVANEGEPSDDYQTDPEGSVSIIQPKFGKIKNPQGRGKVLALKSATVRTAGFTAFNNATLDSSVRIFGPGASVAQDLEPEYITVAADSRTAYVTLQENNAIATIDLASATVTRIKGLGFKDHSLVDAITETFTFKDAALPVIGTTVGNQAIKLGGFSGLAFEGIDEVTGNYKFITNTDRGPNGEPTGVIRPFLLPDFSPEVVRFELNRDTGALTITQRIALKRSDGTTPITGRPNLQVAEGTANTAYNDETGVDLLGNTLAVDPFGGDFEGIVVDPTDGSFWMCDEYRPAIYHFNSSGILIDRFVPIGTAAAAGQEDGYYGTEVLPAVIAQRRQNRGFEGIALYGGKIYAFVQSPARNPVSASNGSLNALQNVRLVEMDTTTHVTRQFIYTLDNANLGGDPNTRADKIGDMVSMGNGDFLAVERDDDSVRDGDAANTIEKKIYRFNLTNATDVSSMSGLIGMTGKTVDQLTVAEMLANSITPVMKTLQVDLVAAGYDNVQKVEGLALVDPFTLAVINDNDFQVAGITINNTTGTFTLNSGYNPEPIVLGLIDMQSNSLDASDKDNVINIRPWPVKGMYLPDTIGSFKVGKRTYLVTANEGDSRDYAGFSEESRVKDLTLDPVAFPLWATLRKDSNLGRLKVTKTLGKNSDNKYSELYSFGGRSFSIWNDAGEQVFDSGDLIEQIIAADPVYGAIFNAGHTNVTRDDRSDDKGPEPEALAIGEIKGSVYAFLGLERISGFMTFDITDPTSPRFLGYINNRDPNTTPALGVGGDVGPEGLLFIEAKDSPTRKPMLAISNEVSSTVTFYNIDWIRGGKKK
jgi:hypothetical protein